MLISNLRHTLDEHSFLYSEMLQLCRFDAQASMMLARFFWWADVVETNMPQRAGWFYKTGTDLKNEIGLTRRGYEKAREILMNLGILDYKRAGVFGKMHFRINTQKLTELVCRLKGQPVPNDAAPAWVDRDGFRLPEWVNLTLWHAYLDMRKEQTGRMVAFQSKRKLVQQLRSIKDLNQDIDKRMEASIAAGWRGFFADGFNRQSGVPVAIQASASDIKQRVQAERIADQAAIATRTPPAEARKHLQNVFSLIKSIQSK